MGWYGTPDGKTRHLDVGRDKRSESKPQYPLRDCPKCGASQKGRLIVLWGMYASEKDTGYKVVCRNCLFMLDKMSATGKEAADLWNGVDKT